MKSKILILLLKISLMTNERHVTKLVNENQEREMERKRQFVKVLKKKISMNYIKAGVK